jgi:hypothetical protein
MEYLNVALQRMSYRDKELLGFRIGCLMHAVNDNALNVFMDQVMTQLFHEARARMRERQMKEEFDDVDCAVAVRNVCSALGIPYEPVTPKRRKVRKRVGRAT